ncbi:hypothetical protein BH10BAC5_BH10BAC5_20340 [soil metagenome]
MKKPLRITLRIFAGFGIFIIMLIIGIYFFIQTDSFNKIALDFGVKRLNEAWNDKNARIDAGSMTGNILHGLTINGGSIVAESDTLLKFHHVYIKYDIWGLLSKEIRLQKLIINSPEVNLMKIKGGGDSTIWNFTKLFTSSKEQKDTSNAPFQWGISVDNFKIENGTFQSFGLATANPKDRFKHSYRKSFDLNDLLLANVELEMNVQYFKDYKNINFNHLAFNTNSDFKLKNLSFNTGINYRDTTTVVWDLTLLSDRSDVRISKLFLNNFNPLDSTTFPNFVNKKLEADLNIRNFNFKDLQYFVPSVDMLDSSVNLSLKADGTYKDLNVKDLTMVFPNSYVNVKGKVLNLQSPSDSLYLDVQAYNLSILPSDILQVYDIAVIRRYVQLGKIYGDIEYIGTFDNFYSKFKVNTVYAGGAEGIVNLDLKNEYYSGNILTNSLDLGKVLNDRSLASRLNMKADFDGSGFAMNRMSSNINYNIWSSSFSGYDIRSSTGKVRAVRNNLALNIRHSSSFGNVIAVGRLNIANMKNPSYALKGNISNFNLAALTHKSSDKSNLNFAYDVNGHGANLNNINGKFNFNIRNSFYGGNNIPAMPLTASIVNAGANSNIKLNSDFFTFDGHGTMNIAAISKAVMYNIKSFSNGIARKLGPDSLGNFMTASLSSTFSLPSDNFTFDYKLAITDSVKANSILSPFGVKFNGWVNGNISNSSTSFTSLTKANIKNFVFNDTAIVLKNFNSDITFDNNYGNISESPLSSFVFDVDAKSEYAAFGNSMIDSLLMKFNMENSAGNLNLFAKQDSTKRVFVNGSLDLASTDIKTNFDSVNVLYDGYHVNNQDNWLINYTPNEKVNFEKVNIVSRNNVLNVSGDYVMNGSSDVTIKGKDLEMNDIYKFINNPDTTNIIRTAPSPLNGKVTTLLVNFKGDIQAPVLIAQVHTDPLNYTDIAFGRFDIDFKYENDMADLKANLINTKQEGSVDITAHVPFTNPLSGDTVKRDYTFSTMPVEAKILAKNFQLQYFLKLIPGLADAKGILNGEIDAGGVAASPELTGGLKITDGTAFLSTTGMNYNYDMAVSTENSKLLVEHISLFNIDDDSKHLDVMGNIDFKGMKLNDIDLNMRGDLVILDKSVDNNDLGVYGYIWAGSGSPAITIKGDLDKLKIGGQFIIKDATINSVPMNGSGYDTEHDKFVYINADKDAYGKIFKDTSYIPADTVIYIERDELARVNPFYKYLYALKDTTALKTNFLDFDLNVKTAKTIYLSIDFNNLTRDRLFGEVQVDMNLSTENNEYIAHGKIDVVGNSYYRLYRNFKISNSYVTFDGPIGDPSINVQAIYTGTHNAEQYGASTSSEVQVKATITGKVSQPEVELHLIENGAEVPGPDAQADAITYLLFGKFQSELGTSETQSIASGVGTTVGSNYVSSILSENIRNVLPFLVDAEFNYSEGNVENTNVQLTSEFGDATVKVGGKLLKEVKNFDFVIDYPLNKMFNLNLPETLMLELYRQQLNSNVLGSDATSTNTGIKVLYKFKF